MTPEPRPFARSLRRCSDRLNALCAATAITLTFIMLALVVLQVIARYGFNTPPQWTEEAARFAMVWAGLLGSTVSFHTRSDPILATPPQRLLRHMPWLVCLVRTFGIALFVVPVLVYSPIFVGHQSVRLTEALELNFAWVVVIVPIWASVLLIHTAADFMNMEPKWT